MVFRSPLYSSTCPLGKGGKIGHFFLLKNVWHILYLYAIQTTDILAHGFQLPFKIWTIPQSGTLLPFKYLIPVQWKSKYQTFEYWKHSHTWLFRVWFKILNLTHYLIRPMAAIFVFTFQNLYCKSGFQTTSDRTFHQLDYFLPFEYQTSLLFRAQMFSDDHSLNFLRKKWGELKKLFFIINTE